MFHAITKLTCLLLVATMACTPVSDDELGSELDEETELETPEDVRLAEEQRGAEIPSATFERVDDPAERARIEELRASSCDPSTRQGPPDGFVAPALARGVVQPRYRVEEDQAQASLDAFVEIAQEDLDGLHMPSDQALAAQARYLDQSERLALGSSPEQAQARAQLKAELLGE